MNTLSTKIMTSRKPHNCDACGRVFPKNTKMEVSAIATDGEIYNWRTCQTCTELINKFGNEFIDEVDHVFYNNCVSNALEHNQTPEQLLEELESKRF